MISVFGSVNVDLTLQLQSLPSLGETVLTAGFTEAIGGKGANQAIAACRDGAVTRFTGCIGEDALGATIKSALQREGINVDGLATVAGKSGLATIWVDERGDNMIAVASGANTMPTAKALSSSGLTPETLVVLQMEVP
ncbi:MAG: PfkB family carbohydrate kinase, partial [Methyloligellaceae bacterium]